MAGGNALKKVEETLRSQLEVLWNIRLGTGSTKVPKDCHNGSRGGLMAPHLKKGAPMATSASEVHLWLAPFLDISLCPILFFTKEEESQSI